MYYTVRSALMTVTASTDEDMSVNINDPDTIMKIFYTPHRLNKLNTSLDGIQDVPVYYKDRTEHKNYYFSAIDSTNLHFEEKLYYQTGFHNNKMKQSAEQEKLYWHWPGDMKPVDLPKCGLNNEFCQSWSIYSKLLIGLAGVAFFILIISLVSKYLHYKNKMQDTSWRINYEDIIIAVRKEELEARYGKDADLSHLTPEEIQELKNNTNYDKLRDTPSTKRNKDKKTDYLSDENEWISVGKFGFYGFVGVYNCEYVAIKRLSNVTGRVQINKKLLMDFKNMREVNCQHLTRFLVVLEVVQHSYLTF